MRNRAKMFDFMGLVRKIFRIKDLVVKERRQLPIKRIPSVRYEKSTRIPSPYSLNCHAGAKRGSVIRVTPTWLGARNLCGREVGCYSGLALVASWSCWTSLRSRSASWVLPMSW